MWMDRRMEEALGERRKRGTLRFLQHGHNDADARPSVDDPIHQATSRDASSSATSHLPISEEMDFSSNDYLGLAHSLDQATLCHDRNSSILATMQEKAKPREGGSASRYCTEPMLGATGSRLLSGDSPAFHELERYLATVHGREAALLFNSGYDANLSVVSSLRCDVLVYDEYVHNSLHMGMRLWKSSGSSSASAAERVSISFRHNSAEHLDHVLRGCRRGDTAVVLIESVYSMDGDVAPVQPILDVCQEHGALLVVDEAHALGVFGRDRRSQPSHREEQQFCGTGVLAQHGVEKHPSLLCSVHTFGKAAGCHGAVVCGSQILKTYLVNYGFPLVYSTALPLHSLVAIRCSYETMTSPKGDDLRIAVFRLVHEFRSGFLRSIGDVILVEESSDGPKGRIYLLPSTSPIQALIIPGNQRCTNFCRLLYGLSRGCIRLFPIKAPTVPVGQERVRIILHTHNTSMEVRHLVSFIRETLRAMSLLRATRFDKSTGIVWSRL